MNVALVYDRVNKFGGAERVLLALHKMFPNAPLYTSIYNPASAQWASVFKVKTSFLQQIPLLRNKHELMPFLMPLAFESFDFSTYDVVISVTSEAAKGIITNNKTLHICYCLTPTRYLWSGYETYFENKLFEFMSQPAVRYLKRWDIIASQRPDAMFSISKEIQQRIGRYYHRNASVIYPPLLLKSHHGRDNGETMIAERPFLLIVSRLVRYKRIDLAIKACNRLRLPLYIVGKGSDYSYLQSIAGPTIRFLGNLTDEQLITYYRNCRGLIFPGQEDFGLTVIEAQHFGKPVLALQEGGAKETIIEGKTGMFFTKPSVGALAEKLEKFVNFRYNPSACKRQAKKFSLSRFENTFEKAIEDLLRKI